MSSYIDNRQAITPTKKAAAPVRPTKKLLELKVVGDVLFRELTGETRVDVVRGWVRKFERAYHDEPAADLRVVVVEVNPQVIVRIDSTGPIVQKIKLDRYRTLFKKWSEPPPIVIDSSGRIAFLLEGRHRVAAAAAAGWTRIRALDLGF